MTTHPFDYGTFWAEVTRYGAAPCFGCEIEPGERDRCRAVSGGIVDAHHVVPKQRLKRLFPHGAYVYEDGTVDQVLAAHRQFMAPNAEEVNGVRVIGLEQLLWDPRNGLSLARYHHDAIEQRRLVVPRLRLPAAVEEFAAELELGWMLDREFGERVAAA